MHPSAAALAPRKRGVLLFGAGRRGQVTSERHEGCWYPGSVLLTSSLDPASAGFFLAAWV